MVLGDIAHPAQRRGPVRLRPVVEDVQRQMRVVAGGVEITLGPLSETTVLGNADWVIAGSGIRDQVHLVMAHPAGGSSTASLSLTVPQAGTGTTMYFYGESGREAASASPLGTDGVISAHQAAIDALIGQIEQPGSGHACDLHFGVRVVEILAAAQQSLTTGCRVDTPR